MALNDDRVHLDADEAVKAYWRKRRQQQTDSALFLKMCILMIVIVASCALIGAILALVVFLLRGA